jgi:aspartyl-tRNA(Asn)/glutamyl-tRNA(Gln) amidotransferase subunit A
MPNLSEVHTHLVPITIGSDSGGSIRGPAKSCGVVGLKPTYGRVSRYGVTTLSWTLDHVGPMARTVADVATMLQVIAGPDPLDDTASRAAVPDYAKAMRAAVKGLRLGVPTGYFFEKVDAEVDAALRKAIAVLRGLGVEIVEARVPNPSMYSAASAVILGSESAAFHQKRLRDHADRMDPLVRERLEASSQYSAVDYIKALRVRTALTAQARQLFQTCDALVLPAGNPAPRIEDEIVGTDIPPTPPPPPRPDVSNFANVSGVPSIVLPCGFTAGPPPLPIGIQFCAAHFNESALFRIGHAYQGATDWHTRTPPGA